MTGNEAGERPEKGASRASASTGAASGAASGASLEWAERLRGVVTEERPDAVAVIGRRAAEALGIGRGDTGGGEPDGTRDGATGRTTDGATNAIVDGTASGPADGPVDGPTGEATTTWRRFESLADCAVAAPDERRANVALFAPDGLEGFERALGAACRLFSARLLLLVESPDLPAPERLFAFGFRRVAVRRRDADEDRSGGDPGDAGDAAGADTEIETAPEAGAPSADAAPAPEAVLYEYRLRDYKQPPDWLNARFWANPARFDLDEESSDYEDGTEEFEDDDLEPGGTGGRDGGEGR